MKSSVSLTLILNTALLMGLAIGSIHASEPAELAIINPMDAPAYQTVITRDLAFDENLRGIFSLRLAGKDSNAPYHPLALSPKGNGSLYLADQGVTQRISERKVENGVLRFTVTDHKGQKWHWQLTAIKSPQEFPQANVLISIKGDQSHETQTVYGEFKPVS